MSREREVAERPRTRRPYRSPRREQQARETRRQILAAATAEFLTSGYAGTTMRGVAAAAGVSLASVEQAFGTKATLLGQVIDVAIAGDDEPVPVLERAPAAAARAADSVTEFLARVSSVLTEAQQRSARLVVVAAEAAAVDPALRGMAEQRLAQRAETAAWIADGIIARGRLRTDVDRAHAVDTVWLLMDPVVFLRLTDDRGWRPERYAGWFCDSAQRLLLAVAPDPEEAEPAPRQRPGNAVGSQDGRDAS